MVLGYDIGKSGNDGIYGDNTKAALIEFQKDFNLEKTGKIDLPTILKFKNKIIEIQLKLKEKGYSLGEYGVDGICGDYTIEGIKNFQKSNGWEANGIIGRDNNSIQRSILFLDKISMVKSFPQKIIDFIKMISTNDKGNFLDIYNKIIQKVFDFIKIEIKVTLLDKEYTQKIGPIKVTTKAKLGGNFSYEGSKYIFKNSLLIETRGWELNILDFVTEFLQETFSLEFKKNIEIFKKKVGETINNGALTIKIGLGKITYDFQIAKKDDLTKLYGGITKLYGTCTIILELDFDLDKIIKKLSEKIYNFLKNLLGPFYNMQTAMVLAGAIIGIGFIGLPFDQFQNILSQFV